MYNSRVKSSSNSPVRPQTQMARVNPTAITNNGASHQLALRRLGAARASFAMLASFANDLPWCPPLPRQGQALDLRLHRLPGDLAHRARLEDRRNGQESVGRGYGMQMVPSSVFVVQVAMSCRLEVKVAWPSFLSRAIIARSSRRA